MIMQEYERQIIVEHAKFLECMRYKKRIEDCMIRYSNNTIEISIIYEPNSDMSDVQIKFLKENEVHSIGWIACVRNGLKINSHERLNNVLKLLGYLKENYNMITSISYCNESSKLIEEFISQKKNEQV